MAPVHFGDLASPSSPGVRLRVGTGPVRLCCGGGFPAPVLLHDWNPDVDPFTDQASGGTYTNSGSSPVVAPGLGGVMASTNGGWLVPTAQTYFPNGLSLYVLIARPVGSLGVAAALAEAKGEGGNVELSASINTGNLASGFYRRISAPTGVGAVTLVSPAVPASGGGAKSVVSVHYRPTNPDEVEIGLAGTYATAIASPAGAAHVFNNLFVGGSRGGLGGVFQIDPLTQFYRLLAFDSGTPDPAVEASLLALLP
jgi:hypothetical protein